MNFVSNISAKGIADVVFAWKPCLNQFVSFSCLVVFSSSAHRAMQFKTNLNKDNISQDAKDETQVYRQ